MSNESTGQQMAVGQAGGSSWVAAVARAVYVIMSVRVVEFSNRGYKIRKIFA